MRFKLFDNAKNNYDDIDGLLIQILKNRELDNPYEYLQLINSKNVEYDPRLLDNINVAKDRLIKAIDNDEYIHIIVDSDPDGNCSAAILYSYIKKDIGYENIGYSLHTGKQHGITDDIIIPDRTKLLLVPDAGSNDYERHRELREKGIDIIVLDHHEADKVSEDAIVVNNQLCNYPNKSLSGAGIVYKFLKILDEEMWLDEADKYLDLVALALISDSMDIRSPETRYYINEGLKNIQNQCFKAFIDKRAYDIQGRVNINNVAFYITPLLNAIIRVGKQDEKELLFNAFIENYMTFKYKKRGEEELIDESIYERIVRLATNAKAKQTREIDKVMKKLIKNIEETQKYKNNIIIINGKEINKSLTGIVAIKIASKYKKPCLVIRKDEETNLYAGSGRNIDYSAIDDLREYINNSNLAKAEGHANAFGIVELKSENIPKLIEYFNNDDSIKDNLFWVDFIIPFEGLSDEIIYTINNLKDNWGQGIKEPLIAITDIDVNNEEISVLGKNLDTLKINIDGVNFIKFKCDLNDELINNKNDMVRIDIIGRCSVNEWNGEVTPQIIIEEYVVKGQGR